MLHKLVVTGDALLPILEPDIMSITRLSSEVVIHIRDNLMKTCHYRLILISYLLDDQVRPSKHNAIITKPIKCT